MGLPTDLLLYFNLGNSIRTPQGFQPKTIGDFVGEFNIDPQLIKNTLQRFVNLGLVVPAGFRGNAPITSEAYYNFNLNKNLIGYGSYDFIASGFVTIRNYFQKSVRPVIVRDQYGDPDIGTCFYVMGNKIITARHCVENMQNIIVADNDDKPLQIKNLAYPLDESVDLAIIELHSNTLPGTPPFMITFLDVLDEILTMGYPPISGFDAIQVAELSRVNAQLKASQGDVIGKDKSYLDQQEYYLINAKVKGGNSGGPIINNMGLAGGMLINIPTDPHDSKKLDMLGYGIAIPGKQLGDLLKAFDDQNESLIKSIPFTNSERGFSTL